MALSLSAVTPRHQPRRQYPPDHANDRGRQSYRTWRPEPRTIGATKKVTGGVIVNIISTAGFQVAFPGMAAYVGSKHAARGLTKSLAVDLAPLGVRVLGVAPSFVPTEGNIAAASEGMAAAAAGIELAAPDVMKQSLIGRTGTPDDIARVVLFAASDLSMIMTGSTLLADAGESL